MYKSAFKQQEYITKTIEALMSLEENRNCYWKTNKRIYKQQKVDVRGTLRNFLESCVFE